MAKAHPKPNPNICSICNGAYTGHGNNAQPINTGRCCDACNPYVIIERLMTIRATHTEEHRYGRH